MDANRAQRMQERMERRRERLERRAQWKMRRRRHPGGHLFFGLVLILIGLVFLLGNMGVIDAGRVFRFWPVILIALGILRLIESEADDYGRGSGMFWIVLGSVFLLMSLDVFRIVFRDIWPVALIGLGILMLWKSSAVRRRGPPDEGVPPASGTDGGGGTGSAADSSSPYSSNSVISATAILGSVERRNNCQDFRGGNATAVMGRCEIDLRAAAVSPSREPVLEVFAMWGGIEIRIPPDWTVVSHVDPVLGGYEDHTQPPREESRRIRIRGTAFMGGIEVTN